MRSYADTTIRAADRVVMVDHGTVVATRPSRSCFLPTARSSGSSPPNWPSNERWVRIARQPIGGAPRRLKHRHQATAARRVARTPRVAMETGFTEGWMDDGWVYGDQDDI